MNEEFLNREANSIDTDGKEESETGTASETDGDKMNIDNSVLSRDFNVEIKDVRSTRDGRKLHKGVNHTHTDADQTQSTALKWP